MKSKFETTLERFDALRQELLAALSGVSPDEWAFRPGERWSLRDILIHLGNWEELAIRSTGQTLRGETPVLAAIADVDRFNVEEVNRFAHLDRAGVLTYLEGTRRELHSLAAQVPDERFAAAGAHLRLVTNHMATHLPQIRETLARARGDAVEAAVHYLGYHRQRILNRVAPEATPLESLFWRPAPEQWSVKEILIHLSVWDRFCAAFLAEWQQGRRLPDPYPPGGLDAWNREQVAARQHLPLADVLHELGAARGALLESVRRLSPDRFHTPTAAEVIEEQRQHDRHHMLAITRLLAEWRKAHGAH
jgi:hypothetical protein